MANEPINFSEILVTPVAQMIQQIGGAVATAQSALDAGAIERQKTLQQEHPELKEIGYQLDFVHSREQKRRVG